MATDYKLIINNTAGAKVAEVTDFWTLAYTKRVNDAGLATFTLSGDHSIVDTMAHRYQVEIHRRDREVDVEHRATRHRAIDAAGTGHGRFAEHRDVALGYRPAPRDQPQCERRLPSGRHASKAHHPLEIALPHGQRWQDPRRARKTERS